MIIGIAGKKQTGKDTLTKHIILGVQKQLALLEVPTVNVKFADKLKDMVCILLGCSREDLENEEFKNKELGPEWQYYEVFTSLEYLNQDGDVKIEEEEFMVATKDEAKSRVKEFNSYAKKHNQAHYFAEIELLNLTPRKILQLLGTECGRKIIHPNIWVNATMADYKPLPNGLEPLWLVSDVRFPNEVKAIKDRGGIIVRMERGTGLKDNHESETALDNYKDWDMVIDNNGDFRGLIEPLNNLIDKINVRYNS